MGKKVLTPERKAHLAKLKKASRLRAKAEKGELTDEQRQELNSLESMPRNRGGRPKRKESNDAVTTDTVVAGSDSDLKNDEVDNSDAQKPPPSPPMVEVMPKRERSSSDWRNKYREESVGREAACIQVALVYTQVLKRLASYIQESGTTPIMGPEQIDTAVFGAAVLTADKFLPDVDFGPEVQVAIGSGLVLSQAAYVAMRKRQERKVPGARAKPFSQPASGETPPGPPPPSTPPPPPEQKPGPNGSTLVGNIRVPDGKVF